MKQETKTLLINKDTKKIWDVPKKSVFDCEVGEMLTNEKLDLHDTLVVGISEQVYFTMPKNEILGDTTNNRLILNLTGMDFTYLDLEKLIRLSKLDEKQKRQSPFICSAIPKLSFSIDLHNVQETDHKGSFSDMLYYYDITTQDMETLVKNGGSREDISKIAKHSFLRKNNGDLYTVFPFMGGSWEWYAKENNKLIEMKVDSDTILAVNLSKGRIEVITGDDITAKTHTVYYRVESIETGMLPSFMEKNNFVFVPTPDTFEEFVEEYRESNPEIVDEILNDMVQSFEEEAEGVDVFADFMRFLEETYDDEDDDGLFS